MKNQTNMSANVVVDRDESSIYPSRMITMNAFTAGKIVKYYDKNGLEILPYDIVGYFANGREHKSEIIQLLENNQVKMKDGFVTDAKNITRITCWCGRDDV